ncbi:uncharacterized protein LOC143877796 [Tasmannia lanceolata]|uniref:uncharacterized protein LOC143877796 n=1 Tax=Tasmannia lanceolata TaxID=3420 RepID=UPI004064BAD6
MPSEEPASRRKHRGSGADEGSKRRKRHHSHHRSHSHRHRSTRDHEKLDGDGDLPLPIVASKFVSRPEDDKEEGEILEEEEVEEDRSKRKLDSDVESGEIKPDETAEEISYPKSDRSTIHGEGHTFLRKGLEEFNLSLLHDDGVDENNLASNRSMKKRNDDIALNSSIGARNETAKDNSKLKPPNDFVLNGCECYSGEQLVSPMQHRSSNDYQGEVEDSGGEIYDLKSGVPFDTKLGRIDGEICSKSSEGDSRHTGSKSPVKGTGEEKNHRDVEPSYLKRRTRSISPVATESLNSSKHRKRDDHGSAVYRSEDVGHNSERYKSRKHSESINANRHSLAYKNSSISPQNLREKYKNAGHSPSYDRYHDEVRNGNHSRSRDNAREGISLSRNDAPERDFQQTVHSREHRAKSYMDNSDQTIPSGCRESTKNDFEREAVVRYHRGDRHDSRDRVKKIDIDRAIRREREWSSSYSRHIGQEDKHSSLDMDRDRDRDRDRAEDIHKERARSSSYSRHVGREDRHNSRERERVRDGEKRRDRNRERDRDSERVNDRDRDRIIRHHKYDGLDDSHGSRDRYKDSRHLRHDELEHHRDTTRSKESVKGGFTKHDLEEREEDEQEDFQERIALKLAEQEEEDIEKIKEESRKRRQAILEKYKQQQSQLHVEARSDEAGTEETASVVDDKPGDQFSPPKVAFNPVSQVPLQGLENRHDSTDVYVADSSFSVGKSPPQNGTAAIEKNPGAGGLGDGTPKSERSADMFCDDIFGESPAGVRKLGKGDAVQVDRSGLHDNWDDAEGYYSYRFGEVLDGRYEVIAAHGKGVFSMVVRAKDLKAGSGDPEELAIKIIRNNETMYKAGLEELIILKKLADADPEDKRHCVRFLSSFKYRNHLCLVFESLHMNLREVLKKFGRNIGLKLTAVRAYAKQLFIALKHLRNCGVLHCDIKPDNMLVNESKNVLKLCDFGNAMFAGKNEITPYLVSRFYRAPEIILGLPYDHPMDIWSVGCCLYELYSGKVLFPGPSNNDMLRLHMELKGSFPKKMLRKGVFTDQHFDQDLNFHATEEDPITKKIVNRLLLNITGKDIVSLVTSSPGEDPKMLANFKDLLERVFMLDPEKRMTVSQALSHPFITGK